MMSLLFRLNVERAELAVVKVVNASENEGGGVDVEEAPPPSEPGPARDTTNGLESESTANRKAGRNASLQSACS